MNELIPFDQAKAIAVFKNPKDMQELLDEIEKKAKDFKPDPTTSDGRKEIGTQAGMVSSSKVVIHEAKMVITSDWAKKKKEVDALGKMAVDFCDRVRDEILETRVKWQAEEDERIAAAALKAEIAADEIEAHERNDLVDREAKMAAWETEQQALVDEHAQQEADELAEKQRLELLEQIRKDAEARATREAAEALEQERQKAAEAEQRGREQAEQAERDRTQAEADKQAAIEREKQRAKDEADRVERERLRIAEQAEREAQQRAANKEIRRKVNNAIVEALVAGGVSQKAAKQVVILVASGEVPAMSIRY